MLLDRIKDKKCRQNSLEIAQRMEKENKVVSPEMEQKLKDMARKYFNIGSFRSLQLVIIGGPQLLVIKCCSL